MTSRLTEVLGSLRERVLGTGGSGGGKSNLKKGGSFHDVTSNSISAISTKRILITSASPSETNMTNPCHDKDKNSILAISLKTLEPCTNVVGSKQNEKAIVTKREREEVREYKEEALQGGVSNAGMASKKQFSRPPVSILSNVNEENRRRPFLLNTLSRKDDIPCNNGSPNGVEDLDISATRTVPTVGGQKIVDINIKKEKVGEFIVPSNRKNKDAFIRRDQVALQENEQEKNDNQCDHNENNNDQFQDFPVKIVTCIHHIVDSTTNNSIISQETRGCDKKHDLGKKVDSHVTFQRATRRSKRKKQKSVKGDAFMTYNNNNNSKKKQKKSGQDIYNELTRTIVETANSRNQVAIAISEPTMSEHEEEMLRRGQMTPQQHMDSWSASRVYEERTWIYVHTDYEIIYNRYFTLLALADDAIEVFGKDYSVNSSNDDDEDNDDIHDDESIDLVDHVKYPLTALSVPDDGKVIWTEETSYNMQECIFSLLEGNAVQWNKKHRTEEDIVQAFTHLVAITMVIYRIDHWHNGTEYKPDKDVVTISRILSNRWRHVLAMSNEQLRQDEAGRRGILMLMVQLEEDWKRSRVNGIINDQFQFRFRSKKLNGLA